MTHDVISFRGLR